MLNNMGLIDRVVRRLLACGVGVLFLMHKISGLPAALLGIAAVAFFLTSLVGTCPIYPTAPPLNPQEE